MLFGSPRPFSFSCSSWRKSLETFLTNIVVPLHITFEHSRHRVYEVILFFNAVSKWQRCTFFWAQALAFAYILSVVRHSEEYPYLNMWRCTRKYRVRRTSALSSESPLRGIAWSIEPVLSWMHPTGSARIVGPSLVFLFSFPFFQVVLRLVVVYYHSSASFLIGSTQVIRHITSSETVRNVPNIQRYFKETLVWNCWSVLVPAQVAKP